MVRDSRIHRTRRQSRRIPERNGYAVSSSQNDRTGSKDSQIEKLPFDPRTLLLGVLKRWKIGALFFLISIPLGIGAGLFLGNRTYSAETVLLHRPGYGIEGLDAEAPSLESLLHLVKIQTNLEETRRQLELENTLEQIGAACDVHVQRDTSLLSIRAEWDDADIAARLANTLRDTFLTMQASIRGEELNQRLATIRRRLDSALERENEAEAALQDFAAKNNIVDLTKKTSLLLERLNAIDMMYRKAVADKNKIELQKDNLSQIVIDLQGKVKKEEAAASTSASNLKILDLQFRRLRDSIYDDKEYRAGLALLSQLELEYERSKRLKEKGLISETDLQKAKAAYEEQKALTLDTDQTEKWKKELKALDDAVIPEEDKKSELTPMLQDMMSKAFDIELEHVAQDEQLKYLEEARNQVQEELDSLPELQREYVTITRNVEVNRNEAETLQTQLNNLSTALETKSTGFSVVSDAKPPVRPIRSNRRLICVAVVLFISYIGLVLMIALELLDKTVKSDAELALKLGLPVIGIIPRQSKGEAAFPAEPYSDLAEAIDIIACGVREIIPKKGARILVVSAGQGEGKSTIIANLAACLGRKDDRVLIVDAQVRPDADGPSLRSLIQDEEGTAGLGEYLSFEADNIQDVVWATRLPGVECLPHVKDAVMPDLLGSNRMKELAEEVSQHFGIVLIEAAPAIKYVDAQLLAKCVDAILLVVRSRERTISSLRKVVKRLENSGTPIIGAILNGVDPLYQDSE